MRECHIGIGWSKDENSHHIIIIPTMATSATPTTAVPPKDDVTTKEQEGHEAVVEVPVAATTTAATAADEDDDDFFANVGFMFEGNQPSKLVRFKWQTPETQKSVAITLSIADDDPGAVISGHYLWPAAELLAKYLLTKETAWQPASVVELGAGCALASLAALQIWQGSLQCLVVTDHDPGTLERACDNHEQTLQEVLDASPTEEDLNANINNLVSIPVSFECLDWGRGKEQAETLDAIREIVQEHTTQNQIRFDLVIGSDLIYCLDIVEPLLTTAADLLALTDESVFVLTQSFLYDKATEEEIDRVCENLEWERSLISDDDKGNRVQEFRRRREG
jgi:predicted nicotinamide N-methyase